MLVGKKHLNDWTHVILDEVHEREEDMDLVMLVCRKLLQTNSRATKVVVMSATLDETKFLRYFAAARAGLPALEVPPVIRLEGRRGAEVEEVYWEQMGHLLATTFPTVRHDRAAFDPSEPRLLESAAWLCAAILRHIDRQEEEAAGAPGAVLVFLPGLGEIRQLHALLEGEGRGRGAPEWRLVALHSSVPWEEHQAIFPALPHNQRKVILSTNIAESSLTIPDVRYVIDFCLTKVTSTRPWPTSRH